MKSDIERLRAHAVSQTLFSPTTLKSAIDRLGFIQADPIRSPASAQDLILRHRVKGYRAGDLERRYSSLEIEEDFLYAYGFLPRPVRELLHPRSAVKLQGLERKVLAAVRGDGPTRPRELEARFGSERVVNDWGGISQATKIALERLHYQGLLRIARRESGLRIYEAAHALAEPAPAEFRFRKLVLLVAEILAPVPEKTLQSVAARLRRPIPGIADHRVVIRELIRLGELERRSVDGLSYLWPTSGSAAGLAAAGSASAGAATETASEKILKAPPRRVRFLAPFDPLVWDRLRFEHLWQWPYRFEAYTPPAKRARGYYAMPLLWGDRVIGWANASVAGGKLSVELGFVGGRPTGHDFREETEAEIARLSAFLSINRDAV
jgi:uncharacterized protein YcaQ